MNKKLMAVAVAAAMAPGLALAQSSVTISGIFKAGLDNIRVNNGTANARNNLNRNEWRVTDNSSRIIFNVTEDLGGGMQAIAQLDVRFSTDVRAQDAGAGAFNNAGNTWVGLRGKSWGTVTMGMHDLHYGKQPDDIATKAGALMASSVSLMDAVSPNGATAAIANNTRTRNVVRYDTPQWGIFSGTVAYSANPTGQETDLSSNVRKGSAWNLNPVLTGAQWQAGYSYWSAKNDGTAVNTVANNQRGDVLYGYYRWGGFKIGLAWNKSRLRAGINAGADVARRTAWNIPLSYAWGKHNIYAHYTRANDDKATANVNDSARMWAFAYVYDLSKRTSVGVTYAKINNNTGAAYNFFTNTPGGAFGSANSAPAAGEDPRLLAFNIRHAF